MAGLMIFGGTLEGRQIAEAFQDTALDVHICVATEYGAALLPVSGNIHIRAGRMTDEEMFSFLSGLCVDCCVDATHPYAVEVTRNARMVCERLHIPYIRVYRREEVREGTEEQSSIRVVCKDNVEEAVSFLQTVPGNILITTGSKELACYTALDNYKTRCFARVLPTAKVVAACSELGFEGKNLIGMQGPFTEELNYCLLRQVKAAWLVTKSSGKEGGFPEKYDAAVRAGVNILVIGRPAAEQEHARELPEVLDYLIKTFGVPDATKQRDMEREESTQEESTQEELTQEKSKQEEAEQEKSTQEKSIQEQPKQEELKQEEAKPEEAKQENSGQEPAKKKAVIRKVDKRSVYLVGMGPGAGSLLTGEARACLAESDVIIGAARMLELCGDYADKPFYRSYKKEEIFAFLSEHPEYRRAAVVYSGDVGFYSGAKGMRELLGSKPDEFEMVPVCGISSPIYLLDRLGVPWEQVCLVSCHGQHVNPVPLIAANDKVCVLLGERGSVSELCQGLTEAGLSSVWVTVGERLTYPDERIVKAAAQELTGQFFDPLSVALFENPAPSEERLGFGIGDGEFIRGKVPMTKEEVRILSLSKLHLKPDSIVYDIGAGTGSVSIEAALQCRKGHVYAIEKKDEAVQLIRENQRKFHAGGLTVVKGEAPDCLAALERPTHAFIGGSSGRLGDIIRLLRAKNEHIRIVVNAVSLETLAQMQAILAEDASLRAEVIQVQVSRSMPACGYHMMKGENPVYIFCLE